MKQTITWKKVPQYTTNFDLYSEPPNYVVFIRIKDFTYDSPVEDWKEKLKGIILKFDLTNERKHYRSGYYDEHRYDRWEYRNKQEFDSEYHFVQEIIDSKIYSRLSDGFEIRPNWWDWEEVEEEN